MRCGVCGASVRVDADLASFVVLCRYCVDPASAIARAPEPPPLFAPVVLPKLAPSPRPTVLGSKPPVLWFDPEDVRSVDGDMRRCDSELD